VASGVGLPLSPEKKKHCRIKFGRAYAVMLVAPSLAEKNKEPGQNALSDVFEGDASWSPHHAPVYKMVSKRDRI